MPTKLFTSENAASYGAKGGLLSVQSRREAKENQKAAVRAARAEANQGDTYQDKTLVRVRLQLDRVFDSFIAETEKANPDASKLDRLAAAQSRLAEQERQLSGRPLPGTLKPTTAKPKRQPSSYPEPVPQFDPQPEQTPGTLPAPPDESWKRFTG